MSELNQIKKRKKFETKGEGEVYGMVITCSVIGLKCMVLLVLSFVTIEEGMSKSSDTDVLNFHTKLMSFGMPITSH